MDHFVCYRPIAHYYRFDDEVGDDCGTLAEAKAQAIALRDARDPVHQDRDDMGASVWLVTADSRGNESLKCVWSEGFVK